MDPSTATDINSGGAVVNPADNPSNGIGVNDLFSQLLDNATTAYTANQASAAAQAAAANAPSSPLAFIRASGVPPWALIGAGLILFALVLRR